MKKTMSVSVDENVSQMGRDMAHESRMSFSSWVEGAMREKATRQTLPDVEIPLEQKEKPGVKTDAEVLAEGQKKIDAMRKEQGITFNPQPKDQARKNGK